MYANPESKPDPNQTAGRQGKEDERASSGTADAAAALAPEDEEASEADTLLCAPAAFAC